MNLFNSIKNIYLKKGCKDLTILREDELYIICEKIDFDNVKELIIYFKNRNKNFKYRIRDLKNGFITMDDISILKKLNDNLYVCSKENFLYNRLYNSITYLDKNDKIIYKKQNNIFINSTKNKFFDFKKMEYIKFKKYLQMNNQSVFLDVNNLFRIFRYKKDEIILKIEKDFIYINNKKFNIKNNIDIDKIENLAYLNDNDLYLLIDKQIIYIDLEKEEMKTINFDKKFKINFISKEINSNNLKYLKITKMELLRINFNEINSSFLINDGILCLYKGIDIKFKEFKEFFNYKEIKNTRLNFLDEKKVNICYILDKRYIYINNINVYKCPFKINNKEIEIDYNINTEELLIRYDNSISIILDKDSNILFCDKINSVFKDINKKINYKKVLIDFMLREE